MTHAAQKPPPQRASRPAFLFPALGLALALLLGQHFMRSLEPSTLLLKSHPPGASVFINGKLIGATPQSLDVRAGHYSLRLEKYGYLPLVQAFTAGNGASGLELKLTPVELGALLVDIKPAGAEVLLDGEFTGHTPLRLEVPVGNYQLVVRKPNFKSYADPVEIINGKCAEYRDFALEDQVLAMLQREVDLAKHRVAHHMDLGHYLFINDNLDAAAVAYGKALEVANTPLNLPKDMDATERKNEERLRAEDIHRLNDEIKKKSHWPGKDVARFRQALDQQKEMLANSRCTEWIWVNTVAEQFVNEGKLDKAQSLYLKHIDAVEKSNAPTLPQAFIALITTRLKLRALVPAKETYEQFTAKFGNQAHLLRQVGHNIYTQYALFESEQRKEVLGLAERAFRGAIALTQASDPEQSSLCKFELANVQMFQQEVTQAIATYQESIAGTKDASTKELRTQRLIECLRSQKMLSEARELLAQLAKSPREQIANKAKADLAELERTAPPKK